MPNNNITELSIKIILRNDILENWEASTLVLEKGEPAVVINLDTMTSKIKIGDGVHTFNELPYVTMTPDEIRTLINESMLEGGSINSVSLSSGTNNGTLKLTVNGVDYDNIAVTGLGSAAYTDTGDYATAEQGARAELSMVYKGNAAGLPVLGVTVGDTYTATSDFVIQSYDSETGEEVSVVSGNMIIAMPDGKWAVKPNGASDVAKSLSQGIAASVTGGVTGTATAANAGETMNIEVTEVNTDYLVQGTRILILNGGGDLIQE